MALGNQIPDKTLLRSVTQKLAQRCSGSGSKVAIEVMSGTVTLTGSLAQEYQRKSIISSMHAITGVKARSRQDDRRATQETRRSLTLARTYARNASPNQAAQQCLACTSFTQTLDISHRIAIAPFHAVSNRGMGLPN